MVTPGLSLRPGCYLAGSLSVAYSNGGPAAAIYGWLLVSTLSISIGLSMAEILSGLPASGGGCPFCLCTVDRPYAAVVRACEDKHIKHGTSDLYTCCRTLFLVELVRLTGLRRSEHTLQVMLSVAQAQASLSGLTSLENRRAKHLALHLVLSDMTAATIALLLPATVPDSPISLAGWQGSTTAPFSPL